MVLDCLHCQLNRNGILHGCYFRNYTALPKVFEHMIMSMLDNLIGIEIVDLRDLIAGVYASFAMGTRHTETHRVVHRSIVHTTVHV